MPTSIFLHITDMVQRDARLPKSGVLTSPNYPNPYPDNHNSTQTITVATGRRIRMVFTHINLEYGNPLENGDYVEIIDGHSGQSKGKFYGLSWRSQPCNGKTAEHPAEEVCRRLCACQVPHEWLLSKWRPFWLEIGVERVRQLSRLSQSDSTA